MELLGHSNVVTFFTQLIYYTADSVTAMNFENTGHEVNLKVLPVLFRYWKWLKHTLLLEAKALAPLTHVAITYIPTYKTLHIGQIVALM